MGMDRHSGSRRHRVNSHRYYKHLLLALLRKVDGLTVETYLRCTLRIIIVNLSSLRSRRMLLQLRTHLEEAGYYGNQPLRLLVRELIQLKCDQDMSNVIGRGRFSEFLSKRELRNLGIDYTGSIEEQLLELSNHDRSERPVEPVELQVELPALPIIFSDEQPEQLQLQDPPTPYLPVTEAELA